MRCCYILVYCQSKYQIIIRWLSIHFTIETCYVVSSIEAGSHWHKTHGLCSWKHFPNITPVVTSVTVWFQSSIRVTKYKYIYIHMSYTQLSICYNVAILVVPSLPLFKLYVLCWHCLTCSGSKYTLHTCCWMFRNQQSINVTKLNIHNQSLISTLLLLKWFKSTFIFCTFTIFKER